LDNFIEAEVKASTDHPEVYKVDNTAVQYQFVTNIYINRDLYSTADIFLLRLIALLYQLYYEADFMVLRLMSFTSDKIMLRFLVKDDRVYYFLRLLPKLNTLLEYMVLSYTHEEDNVAATS